MFLPSSQLSFISYLLPFFYLAHLSFKSFILNLLSTNLFHS